MAFRPEDFRYSSPKMSNRSANVAINYKIQPRLRDGGLDSIF